MELPPVDRPSPSRRLFFFWFRERKAEYRVVVVSVSICLVNLHVGRTHCTYIYMYCLIARLALSPNKENARSSHGNNNKRRRHGAFADLIAGHCKHGPAAAHEADDAPRQLLSTERRIIIGLK
jgi:hypothetical protein